MSVGTFIASVLPRKDHLFRMIYSFNHSPGDYIHWSYIKDPVIKRLKDQVAQSKPVSKRLSSYLLDKMGLAGRYFYDFEEVRLRLALVDGDTLQKLFLFAGAGLYSEKINKIIAKNSVLAVKDAIGEDGYFFASKRAPLLMGIKPWVQLTGDWEECSREHFFALGKRCFEMAFAHEDAALIDRVKLKFPADVQWNFDLEVSEEEGKKAWAYLLKILLKEINKEYSTCFT